MESIFGGFIEFNDNKSFNDFVDNINPEGSLQVIEMAILYGQQNGLYTLEESHILYKCLTKLKEKDGFNSPNGELQQSEGPSSQ